MTRRGWVGFATGVAVGATAAWLFAQSNNQREEEPEVVIVPEVLETPAGRPRRKAKKMRKKEGKGRRKAMTIAATLAAFTVASIAWAQWGAIINPHADAKGYGKSAGLGTAFLNTLDATADLAPGSYVSPDENSVGCPPNGPCGDIALKFTSTSPFVIHVSQVTLGPPSGSCVSLSGGPSFPVSIDVPANGAAPTAFIADALYMVGTAPESCASQTFTLQVTGLTAARA